MNELSREEFSESMDKHLHHVLALQKLNMSSSSNETVKVCLLDSKVYINSVNNILGDVSENILCHLDIYLTIFPIQLLKLVIEYKIKFTYIDARSFLFEIQILAESKGAYISWQLLTRMIFLNHSRPLYFDNSNK